MRARMLSCALLLLPAAEALSAAPTPVRFQTPDGWRIAGLYRPPATGRPVAIMAHGVAAGKNEWEPLAAELAKRGIGSLAIDLRGHGDSQEGPSGRTDYKDFFTTDEWARAQSDIESAAAFLQKQGVPASRIIYIGASIGANLASLARPAPRCLVLLSPGMDYGGVRLARPTPGLPALVAAAPEDGYAAKTASAYAAAGKNITYLRARKGHGAQMFSDQDFLAALLRWLERH